jgi:CubicO group peptidase (beta-lactamase class C family)
MTTTGLLAALLRASRMAIAASVLPLSVTATADGFDAPLAADIDANATEWLASSQAPSVSIAIVQAGRLVYLQAYGQARLQPPLAASTDTRYALDSVSKQFTAAAILILAEHHQLSLEDPVSRWFPNLGAASRVTLRQLLTHTGGLRDFWPQDFVPLELLRPTTTAAVLREWAARGLDFEPGTDWQYSNTGYALAGAIVEKVAGKSLFDFQREHIFVPLNMRRVIEEDAAPLPAEDAAGYTRYGLGQQRPAPKEGAGWLFGAAALAMQPGELALWDISLIKRSLLSASSYQAQRQVVALKDGSTRPYGLGLDVEESQGRLRIGHDGEGSGFLAANRIWPDDGIAVIVLTNNDWASPDDLLDRIAFAVLPPSAAQARARAVFAGFQRGEVDRALFTDNGNAYLTAAALDDLKASLGPLGPARLIELMRESRRGGMITRRWKILCRNRRLQAVERGEPDGRLEQFIVSELQD